MSEPERAYRPYVPAKAVRKPEKQPPWRVLVHHKHRELWESLQERVGEQNALRVWEHLAYTPDQPPKMGTVTAMKGKHVGPLADGTSRVMHYEVSGAGRVDYRYNPGFKTSKSADAHPVVTIVSIDLGSH